LGCKRALLVEIDGPGGPLLVGACHLDSNASPRQRAAQLGALLDRLDGAAAPSGKPVVLGGDFNSSTHDLSSPLAAVCDALRKLVTRGLHAMIEGYMTPDARGERPLFDLLAARGCATDGFNDRAA